MRSMFLIAALFALANCAGTADKVSGGEEIEGWRTDQATGVDTFFMRVPGRATNNAIEQDSPTMMKSTCIDSTKLQALDNIIRKMIGETVTGQSATLDGQSTGALITSVRGGLIRGTQMGQCAPVDKSKKYESCECVHYVTGKGLKKKFELAVEQAAKK